MKIYFKKRPSTNKKKNVETHLQQMTIDNRNKNKKNEFYFSRKTYDPIVKGISNGINKPINVTFEYK